DHRLVDWKTGIRIDHFIARFNQCEHREKDDRFTARNHAYMLLSYSYMPSKRDVLRYRFPQFRQTLGRPVMCPALIERLFACLDYVPGRFEIRLTDFQVNDVASLRFERPRPHQYFEGRLYADARHPLSEFHAVFRK